MPADITLVNLNPARRGSCPAANTGGVSRWARLALRSLGEAGVPCEALAKQGRPTAHNFKVEPRPGVTILGIMLSEDYN